MNNQNPTLELVRCAVRERDLSRKTENAYLNHISRFLEFYGDGEITVRRAAKIGEFLARLEKTAAGSTRNQAHSALVFLYRDVLGQELSDSFAKIRRVPPANKRRETFSHSEAQAILGNLHGVCRLVAALIYGSGLRLAEVVRLRVRDLDFARMKIIVRDPQSGIFERSTMIPALIEKSLRRHLRQVEYLHEEDCLLYYGRTNPPPDARRKSPPANSGFEWQYLFPAAKITHSENGLTRLHIAESTVQKAVAGAVEKAKIRKYGGCLTLRNSFAARLFENGGDVHSISRLLGHKRLKTTLNYLETGSIQAIRSPLD